MTEARRPDVSALTGRRQKPKPRVALCHPRLGYGGSEKRVFWGIEALKGDYDITLITAGDFDLEDMNRYYGTSLKPSDVSVRQAWLPFFMRRNAKAAALRGALYQRFCRRIASEYDILISAYGPCDFGIPAIHFIVDFSWDREISRKFDPLPPSFIYKDTLLRKGYLKIAEKLCDPSGRNIFAEDDLMIAVSPWVAKVMHERYQVDCRVMYSPIPGHFPYIPYADKEPGFVCLGRISSEKRIETIVEILSGVRQKGHDIHLHIIGEIDNTAYGRFIAGIVEANSSWVIAEGRRYGKDKIDCLAGHRFGIHARRAEPFPGAVIEMMKAGCIVFIPGEGGQVAVVDHASLTYSSTDDAVNKIDMVLKNTLLQGELLQHLAVQSGKFTMETFTREMRSVVKAFFDKHSQGLHL
ncbi:MAG: hypothetical protein C0402_16730 [Thermodesulfovibrio sp.]|nr:hypothetical protein [Thermodesulfovibrio sp.]